MVARNWMKSDPDFAAYGFSKASSHGFRGVSESKEGSEMSP